MTQGDRDRIGAGLPADGPRVGLASYDVRDPETTFRPIEPWRRAPLPRRAGVAGWVLGGLFLWSVNLAALAVAGLLVTSVGASDPVAYVAWAAIFALVNASCLVAARLAGFRFGLLLAAAAGLLVVDVALIWLMTVVVRPFNTPVLPDIAKAGVVMWMANLPLAVLYRGRRGPAAPRELA
jgi:hypothetical protein